jgi:hypothetical protein
MALYDDAIAEVNEAVATMRTLMEDFFNSEDVPGQIIANADKGLQEYFIHIPGSRPELKELVKNLREEHTEEQVVDILGKGFECEVDGAEHPFLKITYL